MGSKPVTTRRIFAASAALTTLSASASAANERNIDYAMSIYELTGDPTQLNRLTGMDYPQIDVSKGSVTAVDYKTLNNVVSTLANDNSYIKYDSNGKSTDYKGAVKYLGTLVANGQMSREDATAAAELAGFSFDFDYWGWGYSGIKNIILDVYGNGKTISDTEKSNVSKEIDSIVAGGALTTDEGNNLKKDLGITK